jgi:hypothetical protein
MAELVVMSMRTKDKERCCPVGYAAGMTADAVHYSGRQWRSIQADATDGLYRPAGRASTNPAPIREDAKRACPLKMDARLRDGSGRPGAAGQDRAAIPEKPRGPLKRVSISPRRGSAGPALAPLELS